MWVWFAHLPEHIQAALWTKHKAKFDFLRGLPEEEPDTGET